MKSLVVLFPLTFFVFACVAVLRRSSRCPPTLLKDMENFTSKGTASLCPRISSTKIQLLYHHCIKRWCAESQLTVEEEEEWDPDNALVDELDLSDLGEESEEHDSDDVNFYHDSSDDHDEEEGVTKQ
jgi:hypothetical protein